MRPKKVILVVDPDPDRMGVAMMVLSVHHFAVAGVNTQEQMDEFLKEGSPDAILFNAPGEYRVDTVRFRIPLVTRTPDKPWMDVICRLRDVVRHKSGPPKGKYECVGGKLTRKPTSSNV
jgi:hypothetical protein